MLSTSFSVRRSLKDSMPVGATAPRSTMSLNAACRPGDRLRRSGVALWPRTWQREHSWTILVSPAWMLSLLAVSWGGFWICASEYGGGAGTAGPPNLKAMMRLVFRYFVAALLGGMAPTVIAAPP